MSRRSARSLFALLVASGIGSACLNASEVHVPEADGLYFVLTRDARAERVQEIQGPYPSSEIIVVLRGTDESPESRLLRIDDQRLHELYPRYRRSARLETKVERLDSVVGMCGAEGGLLEEASLRIPLDTLVSRGDTNILSLYRLEPSVEIDQDTRLIESLGLKLPMEPCDQVPRFRFEPVAAGPEILPERVPGLGSIEALDALDEDNLIVFAQQGVARLRRGGMVDRTTDAFLLEEAFQDGPNRRWSILGGKVFPRNWPTGPAFVILAVVVSETEVSGSFDRGAGWARLQLSPEGVWSLDDRREFPAEPVSGRASLRHVFLADEERYFVAGRHLALTATSATANPDVLDRVGFEARKTFELDDGANPLLVLLDRSHVFEGDVFRLDERPRTHALELNFEMSLISAARPRTPPRRWIVGSSDGRLFERGGPGQWEPLPALISDRVANCGTRPTPCGTQSFSRAIVAMASAPDGNGILFGSFGCGALFWRRENDPCAAAIDIPDLTISGAEGGPTVLQELHGRLYLAATDRLLYRVVLD